MSRAKKIEKFGALGISLVSMASGGSVVSTARAALGVISGYVPEDPKLKSALDTAVSSITRALKSAPEFSAADWQRAEALLDMVELTPADLAKHAADADELTEATMQALSVEADDGGGRLFHLCIAVALKAICSDPAALDVAQSLMMRDLRREQRAQGETLAAILNHVQGASPDELRLLARRFGIDGAATMSPQQLKTMLEDKAQEYRALKAEIDAIDTRTAGLGNLKAAARDAVDRLDFAEVEALLSRVDEVETEIMAETKELRARNALMMGDAEAAFRHLSAAADSFAGLDRAEPANRRIGYSELLYHHGLRYGGDGLTLASGMIRAALVDLTRQAQPLLWSEAQNCLANTLSEQGSRSDGAAGTNHLAKAVAAYREALTVRTRTDHPAQWATITQNLATALMEQGNRSMGTAGMDLLAEAVAAHRDALTALTRADHPKQWAMTMQNLGRALQTQGSRTEGRVGTVLLAEAVDACRDALTVLMRDDHPVLWATTVQNLANALSARGLRVQGTAGTGLLEEAVAAYRNALTIFTRDDHPVDWAMTMQDLAITLGAQGGRTEGSAGTGLLAEGVAACRGALTVFTRDDHPLQWAETQENMARLERARAGHDACLDPRPHLKAALAHVEAALEVYDPDHMTFYYEKATRLRDHLLSALT
ncbi:hypothetical protein DEA8626_02140 [Defluviimonas aquaemixtae]|uniref:Uncharacterized protein n=1 Tax=Albidovulum aquaemixtae TaxID=1542388 RepID=A0A2R8B7M5_9RHOB|nr:hypothetical protein [Defluviimonas aquaemixtae]SPH18600.1 hypothetical protein DEA8626_02140 [Defluviimonas aquaemixtae]